MNTRDDIPEFTDLISMLILEEKNLGLDASSSQGKTKSEQAFYSNSGRGRGHGCGQGSGQNQSYGAQQNQGHVGGRGQSRGRGSQRGQGARSNRQQNGVDNRECWGCGEKGHMQRDCPKGKASGKIQGNANMVQETLLQKRRKLILIMLTIIVKLIFLILSFLRG